MPKDKGDKSGAKVVTQQDYLHLCDRNLATAQRKAKVQLFKLNRMQKDIEKEQAKLKEVEGQVAKAFENYEKALADYRTYVLSGQ